MTQLLLDLPDVTALTPPTPDLRDYEIILVNSSGGKDSQASFELTMRAARAARVADRVVCVHADLGEMEWSGVAALAAEHAEHYRVPFIKVRRNGPDFLAAIAARGMFPDSRNRYCTSDFKRSPIRRVMTALTADARSRSGRDQVRLLNVLGLRAQESPARRRLAAFAHDGSPTCPCVPCRRKAAARAELKARKEKIPAGLTGGYGASNGRRHVDTWLPVHHVSTDGIWELIAEAGTRPHPAYGWGLPRLSCSFCVLASRSALVLSAQLRPDLAARIATLETTIGHRFQHKLSMAEVIALAERQPRVEMVEDWAA
ncbi:phosphoadenosine phosphosulfate reductase family protein (plasmid) [Nocardia sp. CA-084685]|uniref:phosphoadenosine phosphosulfate reductase domain-containing protein n=1 Tax=Nocardia sp. CA-084685 TaxID=3239970 RepID=UPI003D970DC1